MKTFFIFKKLFLETIRSKKELLIVLLMPLIFISIFALALSRDFSETEIKVKVFAKKEFYNESKNEVDEFVKNLESIKPENKKGEKKQVFKVEIVKTDSEFKNAKDEVEKNKLDGILVFKSDTVESIGDPASIRFSNFTSISENILTQTPNLIQVKSITPDTVENPFHSGFPAFLVYGILTLISQIAALLMSEIESGRLKRLISTKIKSKDLFFGTVLFELVLGSAQILLMFFAGFIFGFKFSGNVTLALFLCILTLLFSFGMGFLITAVLKTEKSATSLATIFSIVLGFLSGSFFLPLPEIKINLNVWSGNVWELLPTFKMGENLRQVMLFGKGFSDIWQSVIYIFLTEVFIFIFGIWLFSKKQLSAEKE